MMERSGLSLAAAAFLLLAGLPAPAQTPPPGTVVRPAGEDGAVVVPDRFLRRWDAVTVFFGQDHGGRPGAPEHDPGRWVQLSPHHPGAYTWVDGRTLQFRPADPWPPLRRFIWTAGTHAVTLSTLMQAPVGTVPPAGAENLDPVEAITLYFPEPLDPAGLAAMATVELRPLPGFGAAAPRWLTRQDFEVKEVERASPADPAGYVLVLRSPIPLGTRATVHLRLSLDDGPERSFAPYSFATAPPFRIAAVGTRSATYPVAPEGSRYGAEQALDGGDSRWVAVEFSSPLGAVDPVRARQLVRFSPAVDRFEAQVRGNRLVVQAAFAWDTLYRVAVAPTEIRDAKGRPLEAGGESELFVYFPRRPAYLRWAAGQGVLERFGPKTVPLEGREHDRLDLRMFPVDPLDRSFWPFPPGPVAVDEAQRPPGPGEAPAPWTAPSPIGEPDLRAQLAALGAPPVSTLLELPLRKDGGAARFGLDLSPHLARLGGADAPGHYLVGLRPLDAGSERQWMRVQVTDLSLTTLEEAEAVRFLVTSLRTGDPVPEAEVRVEGTCDYPPQWQTLAAGTTGADGSFTWRAGSRRSCSVQRIRAVRGADVLVLDPSRPPDGYADNHWSPTGETWLQWAVGEVSHRTPGPEALAHLFTERPIYRPEETVHIQGYVRERHRGALGHLALTATALVVEGPGDLEWRYPVTLTASGSFHREFLEEGRPTGPYRAHLEGRLPGRLGGGSWRSEPVPFQLEAYRVPLFEVDVHAPRRVPLDRPFDVSLTATYYAGGRVADRPVQWRVTQFPYAWRPKGLEGFYFSSDGRFSRTAHFDAGAVVHRQGATDADGAAALALDPTAEATAQPRTYVVEATVTGADDQTVTGTGQVVALPPFTLGLKAERYLKRAERIDLELLAVGPDEQLLAGQEVTLRVLHRQWHSHLRASDFSDGQAKYLTDVVDEKRYETRLTTAAEPLRHTVPIAEAGVYVVELEARDRLGRAQVVAVDLYAEGDTPVAWPKPETPVFGVETDQPRYAPGQTARFVLQSPFQSAEVLAVVEAPEGNRYQWLAVRGGSATFSLAVERSWVPRLPVHFVLMRGRVEGTRPVPGTATDLGKPATMAATRWIEVEPVEHRVNVALEHPQQALPGRTIEIAVRLTDPGGKPLSGEVALWLVDQAVLSLGQEQPLDPLPSFLTAAGSRLQVRDTRNLAFGEIPFAEYPGGAAAAPAPAAEAAMREAQALLDRVSVRRNFQTVPFYAPHLPVGADGVAVVRVPLPDNLTNFKVRAKAVSGADRFGFAGSQVAVRLPLIVQPALPRFVRPGDAFTGAAIGRVVEGEGGPGSAEIQVEGAALDGPGRVEVAWAPNRPERIEFPVQVAQPPYREDGTLARDEVVFRVGVERAADGAADAFEVRLPIRDDRRRVTVRVLGELTAAAPVDLPTVEGQARPGTVRRSVLLSDQPALIQMVAGLSYLMDYPFGCTEQRISQARAQLALKRFRDVLRLGEGEDQLRRVVQTTLDWIAATVDPNGLTAYWPGARGYVSLTAWVAEFLEEAREAGFTVDASLREALLGALERALRSDYRHFIDGESWAERAYALRALARAGRPAPAYAAELARKAEFLNLEASAQVLYALGAVGGPPQSRGELADRLWHGVVFRLWQGRELYGGLQEQALERNGLILPSETRTVAEMVRSLAGEAGGDPRLQVLVNGLVTLGRGDGWGTTNANASAILALSRVLEPPFAGAAPLKAELRGDGPAGALETGPEAPVAYRVETIAPAGRVVLTKGAGPAVVRAELSWVPSEDGSRVAAAAQGFVVGREALLFADPEAPPRRLAQEAPAAELALRVGDVVEDHVTVVNPADRHYVAVVVPLAAGMEPLNPALATAPPEATPRGRPTLAPTYAAYLDDQVAFYYDTLPKGTYDFYFRTRAAAPGRFVQPAAFAEMMYDGAVRGNGSGARVVVSPRPE